MNYELSIAAPFPAIHHGLRLHRLYDMVKRLVAKISSEVRENPASLDKEFAEVISRENDTISKICFSYACSVADFDDLRQDALINIWRGMKSYRGEASQRTWIYRVTINSCISTIRRQTRHQHESLEELYGLIAADDDDRRESIEQMHRVINSLGVQERAIIMMWLDELTYDEIAAAMGINRNTVATRIHRIKDKIANKFKMEEMI